MSSPNLYYLSEVLLSVLDDVVHLDYALAMSVCSLGVNASHSCVWLARPSQFQPPGVKKGRAHLASS